jgi:hypothetical protein
MKIVETITHYRKQKPCKTASQMEVICCEATGALQCCEEVEKNWSGYSAQDVAEAMGLKLASDGRESPGHYVKITFVARKNPCGEKLTKQDTSPNNCCEGVELLGWDSSESATVISDMSSAVVVVTGGRPPFNVSIRGSGFYLDNQNSRDGIVDGRSIRIYTSAACGCGVITVSDGCSVVSGVVRSDNGRWIERYRNNGGGATGFGGCPARFSDISIGYSHTYEDFSARWKVSQSYSRSVPIAPAFRPYSEVDNQCAKYAPAAPGADHLTGACWDFEHTLEGCPSDRVNTHYADPIPSTNEYSYDPGVHSYSMSDCTATTGWCKAVIRWSMVGSTVIWEWVC